MCAEYIDRCEKIGAVPDEALLGPIAEILQRLATKQGETASDQSGMVS